MVSEVLQLIADTAASTHSDDHACNLLIGRLFLKFPLCIKEISGLSESEQVIGAAFIRSFRSQEVRIVRGWAKRQGDHSSRTNAASINSWRVIWSAFASFGNSRKI
jgi:hypothetical protein